MRDGGILCGLVGPGGAEALRSIRRIQNRFLRGGMRRNDGRLRLALGTPRIGRFGLRGCGLANVGRLRNGLAVARPRLDRRVARAAMAATPRLAARLVVLLTLGPRPFLEKRLAIGNRNLIIGRMNLPKSQETVTSSAA